MPFSFVNDGSEWEVEELTNLLTNHLDISIDNEAFFYDARGLKITL